MKNTTIQNKLQKYGALGATFLALAPHEAEGQIVYVNLPDQQVCATQTLENDASCAFKSDYRFIHLDLDGIKLNVTTQMNGTGAFSTNPNADVLFIANAWLMDNDPMNNDNQAHAFVYGYNNNWDGVSNFMGTATNGYIALLEKDDPIGSGITRASNGWGIMPGILHSTDGVGGVTTNQAGNPDFITSSPTNSVTGYVGVAFEVNGNTHYGWIQLQIDQSVDVQTAGMGGDHTASSCVTILDYAYKTAPEEQILAGEGALDAGTIPTMGEWGLITMALLLLSFGTVLIERREEMLEYGINRGGTMSWRLKFQRLPFDSGKYKKALLFTSMIGALLGLLSVLLTGGITLVDLIGGMVVTPIFAYWIHLLLKDEQTNW